MCSKGIEGIYWKNIHLIGSELFYLFLALIGLLQIPIFVEIPHRKWKKKEQNYLCSYAAEGIFSSIDLIVSYISILRFSSCSR